MTTDQLQAEEQEMSIWDHIGELRTRLIKAMAAMVVTTLLSVSYLATYFIEFLAIPAGGLDQLHAIQVTESAGVYMRVALLSGFIMALPFILYQVIAFVVPGLYPHERRWLYVSIPVATLLFLSGVAFSYYVMLPAAYFFLTHFLPVEQLTTVSAYVDFVTNLMFWIGVSFNMPLLVFILAKFRIVTAGFLLKQWRFAIVIIAILAAMITPTVDPINMALLMAPLFAIYLLSVLFAYFARPHETA